MQEIKKKEILWKDDSCLMSSITYDGIVNCLNKESSDDEPHSFSDSAQTKKPEANFQNQLDDWKNANQVCRPTEEEELGSIACKQFRKLLVETLVESKDNFIIMKLTSRYLQHALPPVQGKNSAACSMA
ncbi:hypothetical protein ACH5RR_008933 [Cinchona calisaya]|uniref:Uncharacterized protein n=1 Tax=Cinchona calisaya TaxID=153742 RepID=A0ABD3ACW0_9GENT